MARLKNAWRLHSFVINCVKMYSINNLQIGVVKHDFSFETNLEIKS